MPRFEPFTQTTPLPEEGAGYERATLDLKLRVDVTKHFHVAKDVAAFANHLGGTLLIGAEETNGRVEKYVPLDESTANEMQSAASQAVRDRCSPRPLVDFVRIPRNRGFVLAVNVWPYVGQLVGVAVKCKKDHDGFGGDAYMFPVRTGVDSVYLLPEQLAMFMLPAVRRAVILLQRIPPGESVRFRQGTYNEGGGQQKALMGEVDELENTLTLQQVDGPQGRRIFPLDQVQTVFKGTHGWFISINKYE